MNLIFYYKCVLQPMENTQGKKNKKHTARFETCRQWLSSSCFKYGTYLCLYKGTCPILKFLLLQNSTVCMQRARSSVGLTE